MHHKKNVFRILNKFQLFYLFNDVNFLTFKKLFSILSSNQIDTLLEIVELSETQTIEFDKNQISKSLFINPYPKSRRGRHFVVVTPDLWRSFEKMNEMLEIEINEKINIISCYRSPAYQSVLFLKEFYKHDFDLEKTKSVIKRPGDSEHQNINKLAVDISNVKSNDLNLKTFSWLNDNAIKYNFYNSYPKSSDSSMEFEPWHWSYRK